MKSMHKVWLETKNRDKYSLRFKWLLYMNKNHLLSFSNFDFHAFWGSVPSTFFTIKTRSKFLFLSTSYVNTRTYVGDAA